MKINISLIDDYKEAIKFEVFFSKFEITILMS